VPDGLLQKFWQKSLCCHSQEGSKNSWKCESLILEFSYNMIQYYFQTSVILSTGWAPSLALDLMQRTWWYWALAFLRHSTLQYSICRHCISIAIFFSKLLNGTHSTIITLSVLALVCRTAFRMWNYQTGVVQKPPYIFLGSFQCSKKTSVNKSN